MLSAPLGALQAHSAVEELREAVDNTAEAQRLLFQAESTLAQGTFDNLVLEVARRAAEALGNALSLVEALATEHSNLDAISSELARTLALLYPVLRTQARSVPPPDFGPRRSRHATQRRSPLPPAPEVKSTLLDGTPIDAVPVAGKERRAYGHRLTLHVDMGLLSDSHFYSGLSLDVSKGGLFVATYQPLPVGTDLRLFFVLPDGTAIEAPGSVRWTRDSDGDTPPGMGVAFRRLSEPARRAIDRYCEHRPAYYHDSGDD
jgi:uncharacterized protein (TIGR02266 family)